MPDDEQTPNFLKTATGKDPVITEAHFEASPTRLYKAWTEPDEIRAWFGSAPNSVVHAAIDLRIGGAWRFAFNNTPGAINALCGKYLEIVPDHQLVFTWVHQKSGARGGLEATTPSQVTVLFQPSVGGTRLIVRHEGIKSKSGRFGVGNDWSDGFTSLLIVLEAEKVESRNMRP